MKWKLKLNVRGSPCPHLRSLIQVDCLIELIIIRGQNMCLSLSLEELVINQLRCLPATHEKAPRLKDNYILHILGTCSCLTTLK